MGEFQSLLVWKRAHLLTIDIYRATASFPDGERFGLTSQSRRSAASIPTNIAEGCGRNSDGELRRSCFIALGSANELHYQLILSRDLGFLPEGEFTSLARRVGELRRMLTALTRKLS